MNEKSFLWIKSGYGGNEPQIRVTVDGETFLIEREHAEKYLLDAILAKGYTAKLEPRQQYRRLFINS